MISFDQYFYKNKVLAQYDISFHAVDIMVPNETTFLNLDTMKVKRFSRNEPHVLNGEFKLFREFGNEIQISVEFFKSQGQEYRKTPYKLKGLICDVLNTADQHVWGSLHVYTDFPPPESVKNI
jgi:hypothetical protein